MILFLTEKEVKELSEGLPPSAVVPSSDCEQIIIALSTKLLWYIKKFGFKYLQD